VVVEGAAGGETGGRDGYWGMKIRMVATIAAAAAAAALTGGELTQ